MKIAVLGTGSVGQHLARGFIALGHDVLVGTRDPQGHSAKVAVDAIGAPVRAAAFPDAAQWCEIALLATLWEGTRSALELAGTANLAGKLVVDVTNPLDFTQGPALALGFDQSGGELVQGWLPRANVVKAFNTVTAPLMFQPKLPGGPPTMFIAGNDAAAKQTVAGLLAQFGWETVDLGGIDGARLLEPLAMLYIRHAIRANDWQIAFKLLRAGG